MQLGKQDEIHWCQPHPKKGNPMALQRKAISPNGAVVPISLATGKTIKRKLGNVYAQIIEFEKPLRGWVWYHECASCDPVPSEPVLSELDLCEDCMKREMLIKVRQEAKTKTNAEYSAQFDTQMDKLTKMLERTVAQSGGERPKLTDAQLAELAPKPEAKFKTRIRKESEMKGPGDAAS
jgi:hypothetical protein